MPTSRLLEIETRLSAIRNELETPDADITALTTETDDLLNERATIKANAEQRKSTLDKIARGLKGTVVADLTHQVPFIVQRFSKIFSTAK